MSLANTTVQQLYQGNGSNTTFAIPFAFISGDLTTIKVYTVSTLGVKTLKTISTHYTLTPGGDNPTNVEFNSAPDANTKVLVIRAVPFTQIMDFLNNLGNSQWEDLEEGLDRIVMMLQQIAQMVGTSFQLNILNQGTIDVNLPLGAAGQILRINSGGTALEWVDDSEIAGPTGATGATGATGPQGPTGATGATGAAGAAGSVIYMQSGAPGGGLGLNNDVYINASNFDIYYKSSGTWGLQGNLVGPAGATGATGPAGATGADGNTVLSGVGAPDSTLGNLGDYYINTQVKTIYGPKVAGPTYWGAPTSLIGPPNGNTILNGSGAPSDLDDGKNGDFYIDTAATDLYGPKTAGAWGSPVSLIGPQGPIGVPGGLPTPFGTTVAPRTIAAAVGLTEAASHMDADAESQVVFVQGPGAGDTPITANPRIQAGTNVGQRMKLVGRNNVNYISLATGNGLALNGTWRSNNSNEMDLWWDGANWSETTRKV